MLELTEKARAAVQAAIDNAGQPVAGLRVAAWDSGQGRLKYEMVLELDQQDDDAVIKAGDLVILIDPASQPKLAGFVIDYVTSREGSGFVFDNPNHRTRTDRGESVG